MSVFFRLSRLCAGAEWKKHIFHQYFSAFSKKFWIHGPMPQPFSRILQEVKFLKYIFVLLQQVLCLQFCWYAFPGMIHELVVYFRRAVKARLEVINARKHIYEYIREYISLQDRSFGKYINTWPNEFDISEL